MIDYYMYLHVLVYCTVAKIYYKQDLILWQHYEVAPFLFYLVQ